MRNEYHFTGKQKRSFAMTTQSALLLRSLAHLVDLRGWRWALPAVLLLLALAAPLGVMAATRLSIPQGALGNQVYNRNSGKCLDVANGSIANNR